MDNIIELDINELVSKRVAEEIETLRSSLAKASKKINEQRREIAKLEETMGGISKFAGMLATLRTQFSFIKADSPDSGGWYDSKAKKQFNFIADIMELVFGIRKTQEWISTRGNGRLETYLAVAYYQHKEEITRLVEVLSPDHEKMNFFIRSFVMPYDYGKQAVVDYVSSPHYCTNAANFGVSSFWMDRGAGKENLPHDLIMRNNHIVEQDVFEILLETIRGGKSNSLYLFALPKFNAQVSDTQIERLGECLINANTKHLQHDTVEKFVKNHMLKFNTKTLDFLYGMVTKDNKFRVLHWENFPREYQARFISSMPIDDALKVLTHYSCRLSPEDKVSLLLERRCGRLDKKVVPARVELLQ